MESASYLVKYIVIAVNLMVAFGGILLLGLGVAAYCKIESVMHNLPKSDVLVSVIFIVLGVSIFIVAFMGFCGACMEHYCLTMAHGILLIIVVVVQVAIIIFTFVTNAHSDENITKELGILFIKSYKSNATTLFNEMEKQLDCCGTYNYTSYWDLGNLNETRLLPDSCCSESNHTQVSLQANTCSTEHAYKIGCISVLVNFFKHYGKPLACFAIGVTIAESIEALFAYSLAKTIKSVLH